MLHHPAAEGRDRQAADVEGTQGQPQPLADADQHILLRNLDVAEGEQAVLDPLESHEIAAVLGLEPFGFPFDDEGGDLGALFPEIVGARRHNHQLGNRAVGGPEFPAVEEPARTVPGACRGSRHLRGVGAGARFGQGEGADRPGGQTRQ